MALTPYYTKAETNVRIQEEIDPLKSGFQGTLAIADVPTQDGYYMASESGTYVNAGGIVVNLEDGITYITKQDAVYTSTVIPVGEGGSVTGGDNWLYPTAGAIMEFEQDSELKLLNEAIKSIKIFNTPSDKLIFKLVNCFVNAGEYHIDLRIAFLDDLNNEYTDINTLPFVLHVSNIAEENIHKIYLTQSYEPWVVEMEFDFSVFNGLHYKYDFQSSTEQESGFQRSGIRPEKITRYPVNNNFVRNNVIGNGTVPLPVGFWLNESLKDLKVSGDRNLMYKVKVFKREANTLSIDVEGCKYDDTGVVDALKENYVLHRVTAKPISTGIIEISLPLISQTTTKSVVSMVIDVDKLPAIDFFGLSDDTHLYDFINIGETEKFITNVFHYVHDGFYNVGANFAPNVAYKSTDSVFIPKGAETLEVTGILDANANIIFMDDDGYILGYGIDDGAGGKYSGVDEFVNPIVNVPVGAKYAKSSTKVYANPNYKILARGVFFDTNFRSIHQALYDNNFEGYFQVSKYNLEKTTKNALDDLNAIQTNYSSGLEGAKMMKFEGSKIIPSFTYSGGTITGGQLCSIDKNGTMYFYNVNQKCIFKSEDEGVTFEVLFDNTIAPDLFNRPGTHGQGRETIIPLDNGELLIPIKRQEEIFSTDPVDRRATYYSLWVTSGGQTSISRAFKFSNESYLKDLDPGDPQYNWPVTSTGAMLSHWTHDVLDNMIVITEYGEKENRYWYEQGEPGGNARGVSGRAWVSMDYGITWKKMFDLNRKIDGNPSNEADNNWFYTSSFLARMSMHLHSIHIDRLRGLIWLTNGDGPNYLYSAKISDIEEWYATAPAVDPEVSPTYQGTDTFPEWNIFPINKMSETSVNGSSYKFHSYGKQQYAVVYSTEYGLMLGHDSSREFAFMLHDKGITADPVIDAMFCFENRADFPTDEAFEDDKKGTTGFVQQITRKDPSTPILWLHDGIVPRIWATYDGLQFKEVFKGVTGDFGFAAALMFDKANGKVYLSPQAGGASADAGYYKIKEY